MWRGERPTRSFAPLSGQVFRHEVGKQEEKSCKAGRSTAEQAESEIGANRVGRRFSEGLHAEGLRSPLGRLLGIRGRRGLGGGADRTGDSRWEPRRLFQPFVEGGRATQRRRENSGCMGVCPPRVRKKWKQEGAKHKASFERMASPHSIRTSRPDAHRRCQRHRSMASGELHAGVGPRPCGCSSRSAPTCARRSRK